MKLDKYDVRIIISDPDSPETKFDIKFERSERQKIMEDPRFEGIVGAILLQFEGMVDEGIDQEEWAKRTNQRIRQLEAEGQ